MNSIVKSIMIISILLLITFSIGVYIYKNISGYNMKIYFFNAGKADCILISNNGKYIMIDTGEESLSDEILNYLNSNNITKLDYLIITHFDKDHVGSSSKIIDSIQIDNVLQSNYPKESEYYNNYITSLENKNIVPKTVSENISFILGDLNITVNGPERIYDNNESNNSSLIVEIVYGRTSYLFTGDIQNDRIKDYLEQNSNKFDFIKIPYHGNYQKKLKDLLEKIESKYAVITCSDSQKEDDEVIELLKKELNIKYYLTRNGSITILSDGEKIKIVQ